MTNAELNTALYQKMFGKNNPKAERIEQDNKPRMDWNREVDRAVISEVPIEDILQIKREHITEPVKRSLERYGNKPEMLSLILNMAIAELVLLITKVLEAIKVIHSRLQRENAHEDKNKAQKQDNGILTADALPPEPVMTPEAAAYPKLKKIKTELDSQNAWSYVKKKYKLNVTNFPFFVIVNSLSLLGPFPSFSDIVPHIHLETNIHNDYEYGLYYRMFQYIQKLVYMHECS